MPYTKLRHDSRNPFQWGCVLGIYLYSLYQLITGVFPGQIDANTDAFVKYVWGIALNLSSFSALIGMSFSMYLRFKKKGNDTSRGLLLEGGGLYFFGAANLVYSFALYLSGKDTAILAGVVFTSIGFAAVARAWMIQRGLRKIAREQRAQRIRVQAMISQSTEEE